MNIAQNTSISSKRRFSLVTNELKKGFSTIADLVLHTSIKKNDAARLDIILSQLAPKSILEIGSFCGVSTRWIHYCAPKADITCIDPWLSEGSVNAEEVFDQMTAPCIKHVTKVKAYFASRNNQAYSVPNGNRDSSSIEPGNYNKRLPIHIPKQYFDVIFVDGDHRTSSSINAFMHGKEISNNLIFHDANLDSHQTALAIIAKEWSGEWDVQHFSDGEDGLALVSRQLNNEASEKSI